MTTRKDIADRVGVSVSVVSRALNGSGYVQAEKKEEILRVARELNYSREPKALRDAPRETKHCKSATFRRVSRWQITSRSPTNTAPDASSTTT